MRGWSLWSSSALNNSAPRSMVRRLWQQRLLPVHRATLGTVLAGLFGQGIVLISGVLVARTLGADDRGTLQLLWLFPAILTLLGGLGLPMSTTYHIARNPLDARSIVGVVVRPALVQVAILTLIHVIILSQILSGESTSVRIAGYTTMVIVPALAMQQYGIAILQGQQRFRLFNLFRLLPLAFYSLAVVCLFLLDLGDLAHIAVAWVCSYALVGAATLAVAIVSLPANNSAGDAPSLSQMLHFGLKGFIGWASPIDNFRLDQLVVGLFLSTPALGLYVVGMACANLPRFLAQSVGMVAYPRIAGRRDARIAYRTIWRFFAFTIAICAIAVVTLELAAGWLVPFFFTEEFTGAVVITRILLIGALAYSARRVLADGARGVGLPMLDTVTEVVSWIILMPALVLLVPRFQVEGVAWALVISSVASLILLAGLIIAYRARLDRKHLALPLVEDVGVSVG